MAFEMKATQFPRQLLSRIATRYARIWRLWNSGVVEAADGDFGWRHNALSERNGGTGMLVRSLRRGSRSERNENGIPALREGDSMHSSLR